MAAQILCLLPPEELLDHVLTAFGKRDRFGGKLLSADRAIDRHHGLVA
ncbi:MAG: hypothetical protein R3F62_20680 [Planctomycetota bacterium]